jgi:nucleoside-diphosphate-sugar epimerase
MPSRVLVTGATGFVGRTLCEVLSERGYLVRAAVRQAPALPLVVGDQVAIGDIGAQTDWTAALAEVDYVVHAAARAHVLNDSPSSASLYNETNTQGTATLAAAAARAGVKRLVFVSSIKVNGESTAADSPFSSHDPSQPVDAYGQSKWLAEQQLADIERRTALQVAVVRPPLVYGPGVKANFLRLMDWVAAGRPLPLGAIDNRRSLVSVWNLCDLVARLLEVAELPERTWLVSDGDALSTPQLIARIARAMHKPARLVAIPESVLRVTGVLLGKGAEMSRLCGSLVVDIDATCRGLNWQPPLDVQESIDRTVRWYLASRP